MDARTPTTRERAFRKLSSLLKPKGKLVISLRHGECHDERTMYEMSTSESAQLANKFGLSYELTNSHVNEDKLGREGVSWQTVVLTLPDDGTGAFPLIRNIVVNDNKSSTYKLALLRSILRIAEGHPGAIIDQNDEFVKLPIGLVAFYWLKLYRPLVDTYKMPQTNNPHTGLGFIKSAGWESLSSVANSDLYLGASFNAGENKTAIALHQTLKDISRTIKYMPVRHITLPGTKEAVFSVETTTSRQKPSSIILNSDYFESFGAIYIPKHIWDAMTQFSIWIEPALLNEWTLKMEQYGVSQASQFSREEYFAALRWDNPQRNTARVRKRVDELLTKENLRCVWSRKHIINPSQYEVDHAFPFARWPNNDLWNLVPSNPKINIHKSDKLPSSAKLTACRQDIIQWWQLAWTNDSSEFFTQATLALPRLKFNNDNFDDVFEAFALQRNRIREIQQLTEWY